MFSGGFCLSQTDTLLYRYLFPLNKINLTWMHWSAASDVSCRAVNQNCRKWPIRMVSKWSHPFLPGSSNFAEKWSQLACTELRPKSTSNHLGQISGFPGNPVWSQPVCAHVSRMPCFTRVACRCSELTKPRVEIDVSAGNRA